MSALVTAMLGYTAAPCAPPATWTVRGNGDPARRCSRLQRSALLGGWRRGPRAGSPVGGTLRERHAVVGQTLLLRVREPRAHSARTAEPGPVVTGVGSRQAARFRRQTERGALLVGGRRRPLTRAPGGRTGREGHAVVGETLLLRVGELRARRRCAGWPLVLPVGVSAAAKALRPRAGTAANARNPTTIPTLRGNLLRADAAPLVVHSPARGRGRR